MPQLPAIKEAPNVFARSIDTEGEITPMLTFRFNRLARIDERAYLYEYYIAQISFASTTYALAERIWLMLHLAVVPYRPIPPAVKPIFTVTSRGSRAVRVCYLARPYFIKWAEEADIVLRLYRESPPHSYSTLVCRERQLEKVGI